MNHPVIIFIEIIAASTVLTWILTDGWLIESVIGNFVLIALLSSILFGVYLYGLTRGIRIGEKNQADLLFREGYQTSKRWRG